MLAVMYCTVRIAGNTSMESKRQVLAAFAFFLARAGWKQSKNYYEPREKPAAK